MFEVHDVLKLLTRKVDDEKSALSKGFLCDCASAELAFERFVDLYKKFERFSYASLGQQYARNTFSMCISDC